VRILRRSAAQGLREHRHLLQGIRVLQKRQPLVELELVGSGEHLEVLRVLQRILRRGLRSRVVGLRLERLGIETGIRVQRLRFRFQTGIRFRFQTGVRFRFQTGIRFRFQTGIRFRFQTGIRVERGRLLEDDQVNQAEVAVIGGSGFYRFLDDATEIDIDTPFGPPSSPLAIGVVGDRSVAFIARHGRSHEIPPHRINSRANMWALREIGISRVIGPCASGSLREDLGPGDLVVLDQLLDRTWGRDDTYLHGPAVEHVSFADPYCPELRAAITAAATSPGGWPGGTVHPSGSVVVIQGPRFSTRAESRWYAGSGLDVINMTQYPEAYLARELGLCYAGVALVTDRDVGVEGDPDNEPVTLEAAMAVLAANVEHTRSLLAAAIPAIAAVASCGCRAGGAPSLATPR
jgi:5'-methylthioadenosine phosphorylase